MSERLTTSIAMATYNGEKFIKEQLDSFAWQAQLPDELVISDDCSTDGTVAICERFAANAPFPVVIHRNEQNLGYTRNFEKALEKCTNEIVFLSDQDDVWYPEKIAWICKQFRNMPEINLIIHDLEYCDIELNRTGQQKIKRIQSTSDPYQNYVTGMATAVRQNFLSCCLPFPNNIDQFSTYDNWLHGCAIVTSSKTVMKKVLADYRRHASNATAEGLLNDITLASYTDYRCKVRSITQQKRYSPTPIEHLQRFLQSKKILLSWVIQNNDELGVPAVTRERLQLSVDRVQSRLFALSKPKAARIPLLVRMYLSGAYSEFSGVKSFFKDLLIN